MRVLPCGDSLLIGILSPEFADLAHQQAEYGKCLLVTGARLDKRQSAEGIDRIS